MFGAADQAGPAAFNDGGVSLLETGRGDDLTLLQPAAFPVADFVQGLQHFLTELGRAFQNGGDGFRGGLVETGQHPLIAVDLEQFVQDELHVAHGSGIAGHGRNPEWCWVAFSNRPTTDSAGGEFRAKFAVSTSFYKIP